MSDELREHDRKEFEDFAIGRGLGITIERGPDGEYTDRTISAMWIAWEYCLERSRRRWREELPLTVRVRYG